MNYDKILIVISSDPTSLKAAQIGFDLASQLNSNVALLYVIDRSKEQINIEAAQTPEDSRMTLLKEAQSSMDNVVQMYKGTKQLYKFTPEGLQKDEIKKIAKEWKADLVVMSTHNRTGLSHLLNGSIAQEVIHESIIPVMVISPQMA